MNTITTTISAFILGAAVAYFSIKFIKRHRDAKVSNHAHDIHFRVRNSQFQDLPHNRKVVFIGDSRIEQGHWDELLDRADISNRGISSYSTTELLSNIAMLVPKEAYAIVVQIGVNDIEKAFDSSQILSNYQAIAEQLAARSQKLIVTSIIQVGGTGEDEKNQRINQLNQDLALMCRNQRYEWLDLNKKLAANGYLSPEFTIDGVHLSGKAYCVAAEEISAFLHGDSKIK